MGYVDAERRLIPAHAGKTLVRTHVTMRESAHPRSRGENRETGRIRVRSLGSSPLTRGKPQQAALAVHALRLIPAHAGKTSSPTAHATRSTAHPRSRGENAPIATTIRPIGGSSPLTRGKLLLDPEEVAVKGLIPAHAGKTTSLSASPTTRRAHPRSRGENCAEV